ncbi:MAG: RDD family protein [Bryobacteraceae bacterium]
MLILLRGLAAAFDLGFVLSYLLSVSFAASRLGIVSSDSPTLHGLGLVFPLLYYGCLDSARCGGGTIGKRLAGLEVRSAAGKELKLYVSAARTVLKFGLPVLTAKLAADIAVFPGRGFVGVATLLGATLFVPISIMIGRGAIGIHDSLLRTCVLRRGMGWEFKNPDWRTYCLATILATAAIALPISAFIRHLTEPTFLTVRSLVNRSEPEMQLAREIQFGKGSESISPFIRRVAVMPSVSEFPTDYEQSYSKLPQEIIKELRGNRGVASIIVYLSPKGYTQHTLRTAVIDRIATVAAPKLISAKDVPTFIWIAFAVESSFGPLQLTESECGVLFARKYGTEANRISLTFAEPSEHEFLFIGFGIAGFTLSHEP